MLQMLYEKITVNEFLHTNAAEYTFCFTSSRCVSKSYPLLMREWGESCCSFNSYNKDKCELWVSSTHKFTKKKCSHIKFRARALLIDVSPHNIKCIARLSGSHFSLIFSYYQSIAFIGNMPLFYVSLSISSCPWLIVCWSAHTNSAQYELAKITHSSNWLSF